jgi:hypothetical protein
MPATPCAARGRKAVSRGRIPVTVNYRERAVFMDFPEGDSIFESLAKDGLIEVGR